MARVVYSQAGRDRRRRHPRRGAGGAGRAARSSSSPTTRRSAATSPPPAPTGSPATPSSPCADRRSDLHGNSSRSPGLRPPRSPTWPMTLLVDPPEDRDGCSSCDVGRSRSEVAHCSPRHWRCRRRRRTPPSPATTGRSPSTPRRFGGRDVFVQGLGDAEATRLTDDPAADMDPMWSADGSRLAFWSDRDGNREIYVMGVGRLRPDEPDQPPGARRRAGVVARRQPHRVHEHPRRRRPRAVRHERRRERPDPLDRRARATTSRPRGRRTAPGSPSPACAAATSTCG